MFLKNLNDNDQSKKLIFKGQSMDDRILIRITNHNSEIEKNERTRENFSHFHSSVATKRNVEF